VFRKFKFEEEIYGKLQSVPLSTQFKLDRVGAKLSTKNWNRFSDEERHVLCHLSVRSQGELECYREYLTYLLRKLKEKADWQDPQVGLLEKAQWENLARIPEGVYLRALRLKVIISPGDWIQLDDLERYALVRLSVENQPMEMFAKALQEFMGISIPLSTLPSRAS
jgi:hypothetical protein